MTSVHEPISIIKGFMYTHAIHGDKYSACFHPSHVPVPINVLTRDPVGTVQFLDSDAKHFGYELGEELSGVTISVLTISGNVTLTGSDDQRVITLSVGLISIHDEDRLVQDIRFPVMHDVHIVSPWYRVSMMLSYLSVMISHGVSRFRYVISGVS
jgi:hypothetical protein